MGSCRRCNSTPPERHRRPWCEQATRSAAFIARVAFRWSRRPPAPVTAPPGPGPPSVPRAPAGGRWARASAGGAPVPPAVAASEVSATIAPAVAPIAQPGDESLANVHDDVDEQVLPIFLE